MPSPNTGFVEVSCGTWHTVGLKEDGTIVVWGRNNYSQLSIAQPNEDYGLGAYGVAPRMGLALGGYEVAISGSNLGDGIPMICRRRDADGTWKYTVGLKYMTDLTLPTGPVPFATFEEYAIMV